jgi:gamma-glutamyltranspeptidase/glutathione hydrolase
VDVPAAKLLSTEMARNRADQIRGGTITRGQSTSIQWPHTANVIAADEAGNLISLTATQGWMYGSHLVVEGMGLVLNHGMSRFDYVTGHPNAPAPGKRMQHNMSPMIALRDGHAAFAFGMPGGPKIVSVTAQLALAAIALGISPAESVSAPRLHSDGDEPLRVSQHVPDEVVAELERKGHTIVKEADMGGPVNVLAIDRESHTIDIASGETTGAVTGI